MSTKKTKASVKQTEKHTDDDFKHAHGDHEEHKEDVARDGFEKWIQDHHSEYNKIMGTFIGASLLLMIGTIVILYLRQGTSCETGKIKISLYFSVFFNLMNAVVCGFLMTSFGRKHANGWAPHIYIGVVIVCLFLIQLEYFKAQDDECYNLAPY